VALALALVARVWLSPTWFARYWSLRWVLDPTGLAYLMLFARKLVPVYFIAVAAAATLAVVLSRRDSETHPTWLLRLPLWSTPSAVSTSLTPFAAARRRTGEVLAAVLVASAIAGVINIFRHYLPAIVMDLVFPIGVAALAGPSPGPAAIPAVAATSTSDSLAAGALWLMLAALVAARWAGAHAYGAISASASDTTTETGAS
jgi:hypothetical protein